MYDNLISAPYNKVSSVSETILEALMTANIQVGYGVLGCALTISRLMNPDTHLEASDEAQFVEDLMEWSGAYYGAGKDKGAS